MTLVKLSHKRDFKSQKSEKGTYREEEEVNSNRKERRKNTEEVIGMNMYYVYMHYVCIKLSKNKLY